MYKPAIKTKPPETTTPVSPAAPATTGISTAVKVGAGAAVVGVTTLAIGGAESGGNYDITFGDTLDKKKNVVRGPNMSPEQMFGKKLVDLTLEEVDTLGRERNKKSPSTSAMGKYQFMNSTLFGARDKKGVFRPGLVQQSGLDMKTSKFTPQVQDKLFQMLHEQDLATLKRLGVPATPGYEYMAHYIGAGGAKAVYDRKNSNMTVQQSLLDANLPDPVHGKTNAELATIKASEFESVLQKRLINHGLNTPHAAALENTNNVGANLNQSSVVNKDMKQSESNIVLIDNTQTTIISKSKGKSPPVITQGNTPDAPMFQRLGY